MFGLTTRGQLPSNTELEFERFYARLSEFLSVSFDENGNLLTTADTTRVIGEVIDYAGPTPPDKWLLCDGSQVSRVTYKSLFEVIGTTYGAGDGSTTFHLPDTRGKFNLSKSASGTGAVLGETGGSLDHTHSASGISISGSTDGSGSHSHSVSGSTSSDGSHAHAQGAHSHAVNSGSPSVAEADDGSPPAIGVYPSTDVDIFNDSGTGSAGSHSHSVGGSTDSVGNHTHNFSASGSGTTDGNNPAYIVFNRIIYAGVS